MADEHRFSAEMPAPTGPTAGRSRWQSCLMGCLVVFVILVVIAILIGFWISRNWRDWAATAATEGIRTGIASSQLPAQEQQEIMVQVDRVAVAFRQNTMSGEQLGKLVEKLVQSPLMSVIVASTIDQSYFAKSGLSEQEKTEGRQTLQRFIRGMLDNKIKESGFDAAMSHVATRQGKNWKLRDKLTDEELRAFLTEAKKQADDVGIPDQAADIDPSGEIKKIVDEALAAPAVPDVPNAVPDEPATIPVDPSAEPTTKSAEPAA